MLEHFEQLTKILLKHQDLWKQSVFKEVNYPSLDNYPKLKSWLFEITDVSLLNYQENNRLLLN